MTNIREAHRKAFAALRDSSFQNFALFSCFVDGQPAAAIVGVTQEGGDYTITPLFVSVTGAMVLTDHDGASAAQEGG
ncbi:MAG: hypothetical protein ACRD7E_27425 [Bryobacteraceae bacterium]